MKHLTSIEAHLPTIFLILDRQVSIWETCDHHSVHRDVIWPSSCSVVAAPCYRQAWASELPFWHRSPHCWITIYLLHYAVSATSTSCMLYAAKRAESKLRSESKVPGNCAHLGKDCATFFALASPAFQVRCAGVLQSAALGFCRQRCPHRSELMLLLSVRDVMSC